ncbi:MAG: hypothetical protein ACMUEL_03660 [Flavobacteriales bacterium Tduv]
MTTKSNYIFHEEYIVKKTDEEIDEKKANTKYITTLFEDMDTEQLLRTFSELIK